MYFVDIARRSSAGGLQLHYTASRGFVGDSWASLLLTIRSEYKSSATCLRLHASQLVRAVIRPRQF